MNSLIKVEHLKYKRTIAKKLLLTAPLFFLLVALLRAASCRLSMPTLEYGSCLIPTPGGPCSLSPWVRLAGRLGD